MDYFRKLGKMDLPSSRSYYQLGLESFLPAMTVVVLIALFISSPSPPERERLGSLMLFVNISNRLSLIMNIMKIQIVVF